MPNRWIGPLITAMLIGAIAAILVANLQVASTTATVKPSPPPAAKPTGQKPGGFREYPIGDEVLKNHIRIAAVWLPPIQMDGMPASAGNDIIHLEADVKATEGNPNGFAMDEFVPYLKISYMITPAAGGKPVHHGELMPMIAADGLHYGASIAMPKAGEYRLTYAFEPPSAGGLGRHSDPVTGVAAWWEPFEVTFDWEYPGPPH